MLLPVAWRWGSVGLLGVGDAWSQPPEAETPSLEVLGFYPAGTLEELSRHQSERERLVLT